MKNWREQRINSSEMVDFCGEVPGDGHNPGVTMWESGCSWIEEKRCTIVTGPEGRWMGCCLVSHLLGDHMY